jgi:hypothetical protein
MTIYYKVQSSTFANGSGQYHARVQHTETVDFDAFLAKVLFRRSTLSEADLRAAFADCNDLLVELVLDGKKVGLPWGYVGASIKGSLDSEEDTVTAGRQRVKVSMSPIQSFQETIETRAQLEKKETIVPRPNLLGYRNLTDGAPEDQLTPGGLARLSGHRLSFDPSDPNQGIFLIPVANGAPLPADSEPVRVSTLGRNSASELIFMVPADLSADHYDLEVRALFGQEVVRSGRLYAIIAVAT